MIQLTRLNGSHYYLNAEIVRFVEETPDTVITLEDGTKLLVKEPAAFVVERVIEYQRKVHTPVRNTGKPAR